MSFPSLYSYWGGHFPGGWRFWGGHFPEPGAVPIVTPDPPGVATLILGSGAVATYSYGSGESKSHSGKERRACLLDSPKESYKGTAHLVGGDVRSMRGILARYAAVGAVFQLALPHEEVSLSTPTTGATISVSTTLLDWALPGVRVLVLVIVSGRPQTLLLVIQAVTSTTITFTTTLGTFGVVGARIMPTIPVYLDATQGFGRHIPAEPVEDWQISARSIQFGWRSAAVAASLVPPTGGILAGLRIVARTPGAAGNAITVQLQAASLGVGVNMTIAEDLNAHTVLIRFRTNVATVQNLWNILVTAAQVGVNGTFTPTDVLHSGTDEWSPTSLAGGLDGALAPIGKGATLTSYDSRPVYDRGLEVAGTASDSIQSLTELIDLGGVPYNVGDTTIADWGRQAMMHSSHRADRQWLKLFLATVLGRWKSFWLPSWRKDLIPISTGAGSAAVKATLPLAPPVAHSGAMDGLTIEALTAGAAGNLITVTFTGDALVTSGELDESGTTVTVRFVPTITTDAQIKTLVNASSALVRITGTTSGLTLQAGDDELGPVHLRGGVDAVGATLLVAQGASSGDFGTWYAQRDRLQIQQANGTITYAKILSVFTDVTGYRLSLDATLSGSAVTLVSWLELVRLESDNVAVTFAGPTFSLNQQARVVQQ